MGMEITGTRRHLEGTLFDTAYLEPEIYLWVRTDDGDLVTAHTPFFPVFYLRGPRPVVERAAAQALARGVAQPRGWTQRLEFWSGAPVPVLACRALRASRLTALVRGLLHAERRLNAYDVDLDPTLSFHSRHGLFPLARVALALEPDAGPDGRQGLGMAGARLVGIRALDDPWDPGYRLPPLRTMTLRLSRSPLLPLERGNSVRVQAGGETLALSPANEAAGLPALAALLTRYDPDIILSERGDQELLPWLLEAAQRTGTDLPLDRAAPAVQRRITRRTRAIVVYGQVLFKASAYPLLGRWHLDGENSFFIDKAGIEGLVELARLSRLPVQRQARASGGTAMTAMEIHLALRRGMLVPFIKDQVEDFRSAAELLRADKGGLSYFPPEGLWEQVLELDFNQQYPTIMAVHNVSPETMDCACCGGTPGADGARKPRNPVPGVAHHTCARRRGLVPEALAGLLAKRLRYKALLKTAAPEDIPRLDARQSAIKWTLVTTFGYQGFKSAKFGHIAAHEAITAWGRETLLIAKEVFEGAGYRLLHALTDSLYVREPEESSRGTADATPPAPAEAEALRLAARVETLTGLRLGLEGRYDWICFPRSRMREGLSVATRYFGRFSTGVLKVRGLKVRRHDTPRFVRQAQQAFLERMAQCGTLAELGAAVPDLLALHRQALVRLRSGAVPAEELAIGARVSREPEHYRGNSPVAVCLRHLEREGLRVPPGQKLRYVIADRAHPDPARRYIPEPFLHTVRDYDAAAYAAMLADALREVAEFLPGAERAWSPPENLSLFTQTPRSLHHTPGHRTPRH